MLLLSHRFTRLQNLICFVSLMEAVTQLSMICLGDEIVCYYWRERILLAIISLVKSFFISISKSLD